MSQTEPRGVDLTAPGEVRIRRALLSVSDKRGIVEFARGLAELGVEIVSTGGTARDLLEEGIEVRSVEDYTGFPEILDGRVKTLNPRIYAGVLAVRSETAHVDTLNSLEIEPIDLVCVNLYPFERVAAQRGVDDAEVIENIDIGGPTLIRAAAKNHAYAAVVVSPESYDAVIEELTESQGKLSRRGRARASRSRRSPTRRATTARSHAGSPSARRTSRRSTRARTRRCSTSPTARTRTSARPTTRRLGARSHLISMVSKLHGRELSFNNLLDLESGRRLVEDFELPAAAIVKHNNPCGAAVGTDLGDAFDRALATDPPSAFGGVFCFNRIVDRALAEKLHAIFVELVFAPGYEDEALEVLMQKPNVRVLENQERRRATINEHDYKRVRGGLLVQDRDTGLELREDMSVATERKPTEQEWGELLFAMRRASTCARTRSCWHGTSAPWGSARAR